MWCPWEAVSRASSMHAGALSASSCLAPNLLCGKPLGSPTIRVYRLPLITAAQLQYARFKGLRETQGRWEARIDGGSSPTKLLFASEEVAAKAYDKAQYKLHGDKAVTNFSLSEHEKLEVTALDWEDLILKLQLQGLPEATPSGLAFHGVHYKDQVWHAHVKRGKQRYVGCFASILDAIKAYDMVEYKLHGSDALLNYFLSEDEASEVETMDWESLVAKLGLKSYNRRKHQKTGYRGVRLIAPGKWVSSFYYRGTIIQLGLFESVDAAVKSYDSFAYKICGEAAKLNGHLSDDEKEQLSKLSMKEVKAALAGLAARPPRTVELGARGARIANGKWEVCVESTMRDSLFLATTANEVEAIEIHDIAAYKLYKDLARTYSDLSAELRENVDSADWGSIAEKFDLQRLPSYYGVKRLVSGKWQSFIHHGGSYLPIGTFASGEVAARATDLCQYKLQGNSRRALYNSQLEDLEKQRVDKLDWRQLIASLRAEQESSSQIAELIEMEAVAAENEEQLTRDQRWTLFLCQEQLIQQKMMRRAARIGQQVVVRRPDLAEQFSPLNRRADGSPMLVEEVMEGLTTPILWTCQCGNLFLKSAAVLTKVKQASCHQPGCIIETNREKSASYGKLSGTLN